jgi:hypothetical protein
MNVSPGSFPQRTAILLAVASIVSVGACAAAMQETHSLEEAKSLAAQDGRYILLDTYGKN